MTTFNEILNKLYEYDYLIGFKDGKGKVLKWRGSGDLDAKSESGYEADLPFTINQLIQVLMARTGIKLFDEAIYNELTEVIYNVLIKHKIVEDENNDKEEKKG